MLKLTDIEPGTASQEFIRWFSATLRNTVSVFTFYLKQSDRISLYGTTIAASAINPTGRTRKGQGWSHITYTQVTLAQLDGATRPWGIAGQYNVNHTYCE